MLNDEMAQTETETYLTTQDLAELFERSPATVRYWVQRRGLDAYGRRFGRDWAFRPEDVLRFIDEVMAGWYTPAQWADERDRLTEVKTELRAMASDGRTGSRQRPAPSGAAFRTFAMGAVRGDLSRAELYRERHERA